ncbi:hypothetical protein PAXRUDRAFT_141014 [Paxillus rubicundulus Ve08.2h10]|uniref:CS domain-containing protein n=1 Tax=Paxillus rubicundulus Ve08.2h10 TaxID=930991 RepID=A0A0D0E367_9AGAM|nr:hypothetical protein PAXRUDRAFT_141014 [Paxillus rubicundulus Ve08.2h10]
MDKDRDSHRHSYSWHQSHDQATVLLLVPYETSKEDVVVVIERNYLLAGVRGQQPTVKGRLYGNIDVANSAWQLEPRTSRLSTRERTTSTISTTSTQSSYAFVSDPEISSSFAASLESGQTSDAEEVVVAVSPALSSSADERPGYQRRSAIGASGAVSPAIQPHALSSFSSLESLPSPSGRLLTLHLEKDQSIIWPSLIVGPVPRELSPSVLVPVALDADPEGNYNMDPTSLVLFAIELFDIRKDREEAFECFVRAWHQAHLPSATMKLVTHYLPLQTPLNVIDVIEEKQRGTISYYVQCIGGSAGLAQLFMEAGLLHLEGAASVLLSASYSTLSSIRVPPAPQAGGGSAEAWKRDRDLAGRYFDRARALHPDLDIPVIPDEASDQHGSGSTHELEMPSLEIHPSTRDSVYSSEQEIVLRRRRAKKDELIFMDELKGKDDIDSAWYLYVPSLVGAGTALLVVGVIGALSFSSWRRNQGS